MFHNALNYYYFPSVNRQFNFVAHCNFGNNNPVYY